MCSVGHQAHVRIAPPPYIYSFSLRQVSAITKFVPSPSTRTQALQLSDVMSTRQQLYTNNSPLLGQTNAGSRHTFQHTQLRMNAGMELQRGN